MIAVRPGLMLLGAATIALTGCAAGHPAAKKKTAPPTPSTSVIMKKTPTPKPHTLAIRLTGNGTTAVTYTIDAKKTERRVTPPWRKTFHLKAVPGGHSWSVTLEQLGGSSHGLVLTDGHVVGDLSSNGGGQTQVSGDLT